MAQVNFKAFMERASGQSASQSKPRVNYFYLKNDQDEAIVRFMIDKPEDFDIIVAHQAKVNGYNRAVNCIRSAKDPVENCPLCEAGYKVSFKFYIHLVEYMPDEQGKIVGVPKVWERSSTYVKTFNDLLQEYGNLSDCVFKVKRNGRQGDKDTTYSILYANQKLYEGAEYAKIPEAFKGYTALGHAVVNKSFEGLQELLKQSEAEPKPLAEQPAYKKTSAPSDSLPFKSFPQPNPVIAAKPETVSIPVSTDEVVPKTATPGAQRSAPSIPQQSGVGSLNNNGFGRPRRFY